MDLHTTRVGDGPAAVFVHGTPSSAFEYRHVMAELAGEYRCLAPDHLGFGASDKPFDADYSLAAHQARFATWLEEEDVRDAIFVLHDFGAAIALPALWAHPERCRGVVLLNTFLWPASGPITWVLRVYASPLGRWLYRLLNISVGVLLPLSWGRRKPLTAELRADYQRPLATARARIATAGFAGELVGKTLRDLAPRAPEVGRWPVRIVWGMADGVVRPQELERWRVALPEASCTRLDDVGHFVAEEAPEEVARAVRELGAWLRQDSEAQEVG